MVRRAGIKHCPRNSGFLARQSTMTEIRAFVGHSFTEGDRVRPLHCIMERPAVQETIMR